MANKTSGSRHGRWSFLAISIILCGTVIWGFWRSYFWPLMTSGVDRLWVIHVHAAVFIGWMALLIIQATSVLRGYTRLHMRLGAAGMAYAAVVFVVGVIVSVLVPVTGAKAGDFPPGVAGLVAVYLVTDMLFFAGFMIAALLYRTSPDLHKRLIICATTALTTAAVGREMPPGSLSFYLVWLAPMFVLIGVDVVTRGRPHLVSVVGLAILSVAFVKNDLLGSIAATRTLGLYLVSPWL